MHNRHFQVWEYIVSHQQLLIRSPKSPGSADRPAQTTNLDLLCLGVEFMSLPRSFHGLELTPATTDEMRLINQVLPDALPERLRILVTKSGRFPIVASFFIFSENNWDIFESPIEFKCQYRNPYEESTHET